MKKDNTAPSALAPLFEKIERLTNPSASASMRVCWW
jgi:hypothetical protein